MAYERTTDPFATNGKSVFIIHIIIKLNLNISDERAVYVIFIKVVRNLLTNFLFIWLSFRTIEKPFLKRNAFLQ